MRMVSVLAVLALSTPLLGGEKVKSGGEKGFAVPAFDVKDVTGPNSNKKLCYR